MSDSRTSLRPVATLALAALAACNDGAGPREVPIRYTSVVASFGFTCALSDAGDPFCWGDASFITDSIPQRLETPEPLVAISAGTDAFAGAVCGIGTTGRVFCWGVYRYGHDEGRGYGNQVDPYEVPGTLGMTSIAVADGHGCGTFPDSTVSCWGSYISAKRGRLLPSMSLADLTATSASSGAPLTRLAAGGEFTCGILPDGQVACWGDSAYVGNPSAAFVHDENPCWLAPACTTTPVAVQGLTGAVKVAAGGSHACALAATGLRCWGYNWALQLGSAIGDHSDTPVTVTLPGGAIDVSAGGGHSCALVDGGAAYCWGDLSMDPANPDPPSPPVKFVVDKGRFVALSAGYKHNCAITERGAIYCWGGPGRALGDGTGKSSATPVRVAEPRP